MRTILSVLLLALCGALHAQPKRAAYDSTYIFDVKRPQVLIGQQVMLLEQNDGYGNSDKALFIKEDGQLKPVSYTESAKLVGSVFTITKMGKVKWGSRNQTLYTMHDSAGTVYFYQLNVNGEISHFTPIMPVGFLKKAEKTYAGKKVMIGWDYSSPGDVYRRIEYVNVYTFLGIGYKRYEDYAGKHVEPYYVLKMPKGTEGRRSVLVREGQILEIYSE